MIKLSIAEALGAMRSIQTILSTKLPVKAAYHLAKIGKVLKEELTNYDVARVALVTRLGKEVMSVGGGTAEAPIPPGPTGQFQVTPENMAEFQASHEELIAIPVEIDLNKISVASLGTQVLIAPNDLMACAALFED